MAWAHKSAPQLAMLFGVSACSLPRALSGIGATHRISALEWVSRTLGFRRCPTLSLAELLDQCRPQTPDHSCTSRNYHEPGNPMRSPEPERETMPIAGG